MRPLHITILEELRQLPAHYLISREGLRNSVRWAVVPQPTWEEIAAALDDLEREGYLAAVRNPLLGLRYAITDKGRAALE